MTIMEIAAQLGEAIKEDARIKELNRCREAYDNDPELAKYMLEYNVQQKALSDQYASADRDQAIIVSIQHRIDELYDLIVNNEAFAELNRTQAVVNELMNSVNQTIMTQITGEEPSGCTHNCSTCGGCH